MAETTIMHVLLAGEFYFGLLFERASYLAPSAQSRSHVGARMADLMETITLVTIVAARWTGLRLVVSPLLAHI